MSGYCKNISFFRKLLDVPVLGAIVLGGTTALCSAAGPQLPGIIVASDSLFNPGTGPGSGNLYVVKPDGTRKCYITNDSNVNTISGWSYDGTKISYFSKPAGNQPEIWIMNSDSTNKTQLTFSPSVGIASAFSPDGTHIVYSGAAPPGHNLEVWVMNSDGTNKHQLTTTTGVATSIDGISYIESNLPNYSPDGTKIVYGSTQSGNIEIWAMNADGTNPSQLTFPGLPTFPDANMPSYSPDGKKIVFWSGYEKNYGQVWVMNADGTGRKQLTFLSALDDPKVSSDDPSWSPDGTSIMFSSSRYDPNLGQRAAQTWVMNADGSNPRVLFSTLYGSGRHPWRDDPVRPGGPTFQCRTGLHGARNLLQKPDM